MANGLRGQGWKQGQQLGALRDNPSHHSIHSFTQQIFTVHLLSAWGRLQADTGDMAEDRTEPPFHGTLRAIPS